MPRVFRDDTSWHMFVRPFDHTLGSWQHYRSPDGEMWHLEDANVFNPASPVGEDAKDMKPIYGLEGRLLPVPLALASGVGPEGNLNQWLCRFDSVTSKQPVLEP